MKKKSAKSGELHVPAKTQCRNCAAVLNGPFCSECGQKAIEHSVSIPGFLRETFSDLFSFHSRTFSTFLDLLVKPGSLTWAYFSGQKVRYAPPMQVYLIAAAIFFLVNSYHSFIQLSDQNKVRSAIGLIRTGQQLSPSKIEALQNQGVSMDLFRERFKSTVSQSLPHFMIGSVLLFAFVLWLFHPLRPGLYQIVFALHWTAFYLILMSIEGLFLFWGNESVLARSPLSLWALVHLVISLRKVYSYGWIRAAIGGLLLFLLFNVILIAWVLSVGFFSFASVT